MLPSIICTYHASAPLWGGVYYGVMRTEVVRDEPWGECSVDFFAERSRFRQRECLRLVSKEAQIHQQPPGPCEMLPASPRTL